MDGGNQTESAGIATIVEGIPRAGNCCCKKSPTGCVSETGNGATAQFLDRSLLNVSMCWMTYRPSVVTRQPLSDCRWTVISARSQALHSILAKTCSHARITNYMTFNEFTTCCQTDQRRRMGLETKRYGDEWRWIQTLWGWVGMGLQSCPHEDL